MLDNYLNVFYTQKQGYLIEGIMQGKDRINPCDYLSIISMLFYDCYDYMITF